KYERAKATNGRAKRKVVKVIRETQEEKHFYQQEIEAKEEQLKQAGAELQQAKEERDRAEKEADAALIECHRLREARERSEAKARLVEQEMARLREVLRPSQMALHRAEAKQLRAELNEARAEIARLRRPTPMNDPETPPYSPQSPAPYTQPAPKLTYLVDRVNNAPPGAISNDPALTTLFKDAPRPLRLYFAHLLGQMRDNYSSHEVVAAASRNYLYNNQPLAQLQQPL
ncbi:unnamed protein product, partial [Mesorhabditis spiculigera]